mmetsp:Transcript_28135/g.66586  ORF Transcript_28135/g.66586 Transcript_28135/m.66586 type:complete len:270 (+) Transcript_28135:881-1690(+)|eukprot:2666766-Rhodomonas_salina.3
MSWVHASAGLAMSECCARKREETPYASIEICIIGRTCSPKSSHSRTVRSLTPMASTSVASSRMAAASASPGLPCTPTTPIASGCDSSITPLASSRVTTGECSTSASCKISAPAPRASRPTATTTRSPGIASCAATASRVSLSPRVFSTRLRISDGCAEHRCVGAWIIIPWMSTGTATCTQTRCESAVATASRIIDTSCRGSHTVTEYGSPPAANIRAWSMSWNSECAESARGFVPVIAMRGTRSSCASSRPVTRLDAPGPDVAIHAPSR